MRDVDAVTVESNYSQARERFRNYGVDTDAALKRLSSVSVSMNCWAGDDVVGFEGADSLSGGGILATGSFPGRARTAEELRQDAELAYSLIPGQHRFNLHGSYCETGGEAVDRDALQPTHFENWMAWAKRLGIGLDFNPTFFSHPKADSGYTLSSYDEQVRSFWVEHAKRSREISAAIGKRLGTACVNNLWIPDGSKDEPTDRMRRRALLVESLDEIYREPMDRTQVLDAVESKLFGIGSEAFVVGSHEFYLGYALSRDVLLTMDAGHYHPTESLAEKIAALLPFVEELMLHLSRPVRWDSDHVVVYDDPTRAIGREIVRADALDRVYLAVDFFDASINRISAWVIGMRSTLKAVLDALLEPVELMRKAEQQEDLGTRLALMEEFKMLPIGAVWDKFCLDQDVPLGAAWLERVKQYEADILLKRR